VNFFEMSGLLKTIIHRIKRMAACMHSFIMAILIGMTNLDIALLLSLFLVHGSYCCCCC
jgi:hypothetical protein